MHMQNSPRVRNTSIGVLKTLCLEACFYTDILTASEVAEKRLIDFACSIVQFRRGMANGVWTSASALYSNVLLVR